MALKHLPSGTREISVSYFSGILQPLRFEDLGFQKTLRLLNRLKPGGVICHCVLTLILFLLQYSLKNWGKGTFARQNYFIGNFMYIQVNTPPCPQAHVITSLDAQCYCEDPKEFKQNLNLKSEQKGALEAQPLPFVNPRDAGLGETGTPRVGDARPPRWLCCSCSGTAGSSALGNWLTTSFHSKPHVFVVTLESGYRLSPLAAQESALCCP